LQFFHFRVVTVSVHFKLMDGHITGQWRIHEGRAKGEIAPPQMACKTCYQTQFSGLKPHQNQQRLGLCPIPHWGA